MDLDLRRMMLAYYDERAPEYEEAYTLGTGTASISDPNVFITDIAHLVEVVARFGHGELIDLGCGTGYWLPHYAGNCSRVTLFDQSEHMLLECREKVRARGLDDRCVFIQGDAFDYRFDRNAYDCALLGFLLSHVTEQEEAMLCTSVRRMLRPSGRLLILESAWTALRVKFNQKVERQARKLNDGTTFDIYKRYIDQADIARWSEKYGLIARVEYFGPALCAVSGSFPD